MSEENYVRYKVIRMVRAVERKKALQREAKTEFLDPFIRNVNLSPNEIRAYGLAYLEEQQINRNSKEKLKNTFLNGLTPENIIEVKDLISEKDYIYN